MTHQAMGLPPLPISLLHGLLPMHLACDGQGAILSVGPCLAKMMGGDLAGHILDHITIRTPQGVGDVAALRGLTGRAITVALGAAPDLMLRAAVVPFGQGVVMNLSLGMSFVEAVARFDLTLDDFAPTDQVPDLMFLNEVYGLVSRETRALTERLFAARTRAEAEALTDPLTGLANRRALDRALRRLTSAPRQDFALLHLDLDHFKPVNDRLGHAMGDRVLAQIGRVLQRDLRINDTAARVGGDEFVILLQGRYAPEALLDLATRLIRAIERPIETPEGVVRVSASIGIAQSAPALSDEDGAEGDGAEGDEAEGGGAEGGADCAALLAAADAALYRAKDAGRGQAMLA